MKRNAMLCVAMVFVAASLGLSGVRAQAADRPAYRHAYYLFLADAPKGCEDCYVPMLITVEPLAKSPASGVLIITYERDSIWHDDGIVSFAGGDIQVGPRIMTLRGRRYRYQEVSSAEVLKLLENPQGTIPISRPYQPPASAPGPSLTELIAGFVAVK